MHRPLVLFGLLLALTSYSMAAPPMLPEESKVRQIASDRFGGQSGMVWSAARSVPHLLLRLNTRVSGKTATDRARDFIKRHGDLLGGVRVADMGPGKVTRVNSRDVVHMQQLNDGIPVEGRYVAVSFHPSGRVRRVNSDYVRVQLPSISTDIGVQGAKQMIAEHWPGRPVGSQVVRVVLANTTGAARLAYRITTAVLPPMIYEHVWIDAENGAVLQRKRLGKDIPGEVHP